MQLMCYLYNQNDYNTIMLQIIWVWIYHFKYMPQKILSWSWIIHHKNDPIHFFSPKICFLKQYKATDLLIEFHFSGYILEESKIHYHLESWSWGNSGVQLMAQDKRSRAEEGTHRNKSVGKRATVTSHHTHPERSHLLGSFLPVCQNEKIGWRGNSTLPLLFLTFHYVREPGLFSYWMILSVDEFKEPIRQAGKSWVFLSCFLLLTQSSDLESGVIKI